MTLMMTYMTINITLALELLGGLVITQLHDFHDYYDDLYIIGAVCDVFAYFIFSHF